MSHPDARVLGMTALCPFEGCDRPPRYPGEELCQGHYTQRYRGQELRPLRNRVSPRKTAVGAAQVIDEFGRKLCSQCLELKDLSEFYANNRNKSGWDYACKTCRVRLYDSPEKNRVFKLRQKYGITVAQYEELLQAQGGKCAICRRFPTEGIMLHVDHDHSCCPGDKTCGSCIRGLLCLNCNTAIGYLGDDHERIQRAAAYVSTPKELPHEPRPAAKTQ